MSHITNIKHCFQMMVLHSSVEKITSNKQMMLNLFGVTLCIALVSRYLVPDVNAVHATINTIMEYGFLLCAAYAALGFFGFKEKFVVLATALLGIGLIGDSMFVIARLVMPGGEIGMWALSFIAVQLFGMHQAFKTTMDLQDITAAFLTGLYFFGAMGLLGFTQETFNWLATL